MAELPQVCPGLHLPVQSGSDAQLRRMRRGYTVGEYRDLVQGLRAAVPDLALTTDIVVGFCGESEADFARTVALMEEIRFDSAFMFKYSEREGTYAHRKMDDDVPESVKGERLQQIIALQEGISREINQRQVGRTVQVLVEGPSRRSSAGKPTFYGRSPQGKVVAFPQETLANSLVHVRITRATSHTLFGDLTAGT
jgi:tRNA-2-methylthio-N6-dimethylallyladenosine synthase